METNQDGLVSLLKPSIYDKAQRPKRPRYYKSDDGVLWTSNCLLCDCTSEIYNGNFMTLPLYGSELPSRANANQNDIDTIDILACLSEFVGYSLNGITAWSKYLCGRCVATIRHFLGSKKAIVALLKGNYSKRIRTTDTADDSPRDIPRNTTKRFNAPNPPKSRSINEERALINRQETLAPKQGKQVEKPAVFMVRPIKSFKPIAPKPPPGTPVVQQATSGLTSDRPNTSTNDTTLLTEDMQITTGVQEMEGSVPERLNCSVESVESLTHKRESSHISSDDGMIIKTPRVDHQGKSLAGNIWMMDTPSVHLSVESIKSEPMDEGYDNENEQSFGDSEDDNILSQQSVGVQPSPAFTNKAVTSKSVCVSTSSSTFVCHSNIQNQSQPEALMNTGVQITPSLAGSLPVPFSPVLPPGGSAAIIQNNHQLTSPSSISNVFPLKLSKSVALQSSIPTAAQSLMTSTCRKKVSTPQQQQTAKNKQVGFGSQNSQTDDIIGLSSIFSSPQGTSFEKKKQAILQPDQSNVHKFASLQPNIPHGAIVQQKMSTSDTTALHSDCPYVGNAVTQLTSVSQQSNSVFGIGTLQPNATSVVPIVQQQPILMSLKGNVVSGVRTLQANASSAVSTIRPQQHILMQQQNNIVSGVGTVQPNATSAVLSVQQQHTLMPQQRYIVSGVGALHANATSAVSIPQQHILMQQQKNIVSGVGTLQPNATSTVSIPQQHILMQQQSNIVSGVGTLQANATSAVSTIRPQQHILMPQQRNIVSGVGTLQANTTSAVSTIRPQQHILMQQQSNVVSGVGTVQANATAAVSTVLPQQQHPLLPESYIISGVGANKVDRRCKVTWMTAAQIHHYTVSDENVNVAIKCLAQGQIESAFEALQNVKSFAQAAFESTLEKIYWDTKAVFTDKTNAILGIPNVAQLHLVTAQVISSEIRAKAPLFHQLLDTLLTPICRKQMRYKWEEVMDRHVKITGLFTIMASSRCTYKTAWALKTSLFLHHGGLNSRAFRKLSMQGICICLGLTIRARRAMAALTNKDLQNTLESQGKNEEDEESDFEEDDLEGKVKFIVYNKDEWDPKGKVTEG